MLYYDEIVFLPTFVYLKIQIAYMTHIIII